MGSRKEVSLCVMTPEMYRAYFREYENDPALYLPGQPYAPYVYSEEAVERYVRRQQDLGRIPLAILYGDELAGEIVLKNIEPGRRATMGIALKNASWKDRGIGTEAERLAVEYVFRELDIPVLYADALRGNARSRHVLEKAGFDRIREDRDFVYYRIDRDLHLEIREMETEEEIRGKAYVHWRCWQEAYRDLVSREYLERLTLEKCEETAFRWRDNLLVAKDNGRVVGFLGYGEGQDPPEGGEVYALYVLPEYWGRGVAQRLMRAGLERLKDCPRVRLWVLKENRRAIRFYEKYGFSPDGEEKPLPSLAAEEIRMTLERAGEDWTDAKERGPAGEKK